MRQFYESNISENQNNSLKLQVNSKLLQNQQTPYTSTLIISKLISSLLSRATFTWEL